MFLVLLVYITTRTKMFTFLTWENVIYNLEKYFQLT